MDDDVVSLTCLPDADGDSFGDPSSMMSSCACPEGFVPSRPENDCNDNAGFVRPNLAESLFPERPYCADGTVATGEHPSFTCADQSVPSFDYDCDEEEEPQFDAIFEACTIDLLGGCSGAGWNDEVPACGETGKAFSCVTECDFGPCPIGRCDPTNSVLRTQGCR